MLEFGEETHMASVEVYQSSFVRTTECHDGLLIRDATARALHDPLRKCLVHELPLFFLHIVPFDCCLRVPISANHLHPRFIRREGDGAVCSCVAHVRLTHPFLHRDQEAPHLFRCLRRLSVRIATQTLNMFVSW